MPPKAKPRASAATNDAANPVLPSAVAFLHMASAASVSRTLQLVGVQGASRRNLKRKQRDVVDSPTVYGQVLQSRTLPGHDFRLVNCNWIVTPSR